MSGNAANLVGSRLALLGGKTFNYHTYLTFSLYCE